MAQRYNQEFTLLASAARTASANSDDQTNAAARGVVLFINCTASADTPSVVANVQMKDPVSGAYKTIASATAFTGASTTVLVCYPGAADVLTATGVDAQDIPLPKTWRVAMTHADADSITYSVGGSYVL